MFDTFNTLAALPLLLWIGLALQDVVAFHKRVAGSYKTPWYSRNWMLHPYTNFRLALSPARDYWTTNAVGSERWLLREVLVGDVEFWTILQRAPV